VTVVANVTRGTILASRAEVARGPWRNLIGLMGRAVLPAGAGLVLPRTRGVHTHFMRFPIDVVFYDRHRHVVAVSHALRPWRFSRYHLRARGALELPAGTARCSGTEVGDALDLAEGADATTRPVAAQPGA
jgi:uncharacterized membrane protein (UPF0127 family)